MPMKNPPHPGRSVRENCLDPLGLSVTDAAEVLGVARHTLSRVLNGHAADLARHGHPPREGRMVHRRLLVEPPDRIRPRPSAQTRRQNKRPALPAPTHHVRNP